MVAAPMIAGAEAPRRAAADRRRPGESLLFSSLEMNSQKIGERGATGRRGGSNDSYVEKECITRGGPIVP